jgi:hypothetical protein
VFDVLAKEIPIHETPGMSMSSRKISAESVSLIESQMPFMKHVVRNRGVLRMVQEMISESFPASPAESIQDQAPGVYRASGEAGGHLCSEHCALFHSATFFDPTNINIEPDSMMDSGLVGGYGGFEDSIMFPALFGSAEF